MSTKTKKVRQPFVRHTEALRANIIKFVKGGGTFMGAKEKFGVSAHFASALIKREGIKLPAKPAKSNSADKAVKAVKASGRKAKSDDLLD
jgi:transposase